MKAEKRFGNLRLRSSDSKDEQQMRDLESFFGHSQLAKYLTLISVMPLGRSKNGLSYAKVFYSQQARFSLFSAILSVLSVKQELKHIASEG